MKELSQPIESTCCFTGHRPKKLSTDEKLIRVALARKIKEAVSDGYFVFISGMAHGVDLWAAEAVLEEKANNPHIKLICAFPFLKERFDAEEAKIKNAADEVKFISDSYCRNCFILRDCWMVDHSSRVIAVFNGTPGGTAKTIEYAKESGKETVIIGCEKPGIDSSGQTWYDC